MIYDAYGRGYVSSIEMLMNLSAGIELNPEIGASLAGARHYWSKEESDKRLEANRKNFDRKFGGLRK